MFVWAPMPERFASLGSLEFSKLLLEKAQVAVAPGVGFGPAGEGFVRFALVENRHRIRQAVPLACESCSAMAERALRVGLVGFGTIGTGVVRAFQSHGAP